ncbi:hypothetical protein [Natrinema altunense]|uniref:Uncharacterized protein n=1 Tax=Natrinema altunense (strain JCM 12890 / CGMCC 1.3731 / AJ2) TaxID=1227494 RepID=L9ZUE6_NATA2|nr:hypothetical protein [Natrinema altunense]ELY89716.1 hypothetical protein C485_04440 [Natrinema altunense JCM 12890]
MARHVSERQVRHWLDETAIQNVTSNADEDTDLNIQVELSRLPVHVIEEDEFGPFESSIEADSTRSSTRTVRPASWARRRRDR